MPHKPKKICAFPNCPALTDSRYCDKHAKEEAKRYNKYDRDPATAKRYDATWRQIRERFLAANPLCEMCKADGRFKPAELVHHKRKLSDGGTNAAENLQALCGECHSRLHAEQGDYF
jgi:5-methylcytosine-specific restriction protein A